MITPPFTELCEKYNVKPEYCDSVEEILQDEMRMLNEIIEKAINASTEDKAITFGEAADIGAYRQALEHLWNRYEYEIIHRLGGYIKW